MNSRRPHVAVSGDATRTRRAAIVIVATALLVACGGSDDTSVDSSSPITSGSSTSSSTVPATTPPSQPTSAPTVAETTVAPTVAPISDPVAESTTPPVTEPVGTTPNTDTDADADTGGGYRPADATSPLAGGMSDPISSPLPDGIFWSWQYTSDGSTTRLALSQFFTGDACREQFGDADDACASDNETLYDPTETVTTSGDGVVTTVLVSDGAGGHDRFGVSAAEFMRLASGQDPAADAPAGYTFEQLPVTVTVRSGEVVALDQFFVS